MDTEAQGRTTKRLLPKQSSAASGVHCNLYIFYKALAYVEGVWQSDKECALV